MELPPTIIYIFFAGSNVKASNSIPAQSQEVGLSARTWRAGPCYFCGKFETGHYCKSCRKLCCNLCNTIHVEDLADIICPECSHQVADELVPESDDVEDVAEVFKEGKKKLTQL